MNETKKEMTNTEEKRMEKYIEVNQHFTEMQTNIDDKHSESKRIRKVVVHYHESQQKKDIRTYIQTKIHTYIHTSIQTYKRSIHVNMHTNIPVNAYADRRPPRKRIFISKTEASAFFSREKSD
jgi:hypothetical protein